MKNAFQGKDVCSFVNFEPNHASLETPSQQGWPTAEIVDGASGGPVPLVGMVDPTSIMDVSDL